jgi:hypothetical protein
MEGPIHLLVVAEMLQPWFLAEGPKTDTKLRFETKT